MKKIIAVVMFFMIILLPTNVYANKHIPISVSAEAAILMELESGRILYKKNEHEKMRIASITKIMTAILAIESGKMDEFVRISKRAEGVEGSSIYLRAGERMKLEDLVYGLMLRSGNDAAIAIAEHVAGSVEGFVFLMNEKAREIGMTNTSFKNPHGLDDHEEHYSTAYDMALLSKYAMENDKYREISAAKRHEVSGEQRRIWTNKNRLLTELYRYSTGGKTGYTKRAKRTLVSTAMKNDMELVCVTLNAPSDWHDHMNLFNWAYETYQMERLIKEGIQKEITDPFYRNRIYTTYSFEYPLNEEEREQVNKEITLYRPPNDEKRRSYVPPSPVGKITLTMNGEKIGEIPLYYEHEEDEQKKGMWLRLLEKIFFITGGEKR